MNKVAAAVYGRTQQPRPRTKISSMSGQSALVSSKYVSNVTSSNGAGAGVHVSLINPPLIAAANDAGGAVLRNYQEYTIDRAVITHTPMVGTTTPGTIWIGYYDNPEIILKLFAGTYTTAEATALAKQSPISVSGPVWMPLSLAASSSKRRAKLASDSTTPTDRFQVDLTTHGCFVVALEGGPVTTAYGTTSLEYTARGYHLENNSIAGV